MRWRHAQWVITIGLCTHLSMSLSACTRDSDNHAGAQTAVTTPTQPPPSGARTSKAASVPTNSAAGPVAKGSPSRVDAVWKASQSGNCAPPMPHGFTFTASAEHSQLWLGAAIWRDGVGRDHIPVAPTEPEIEQARCYASGPHLDLNPANWCCRDEVLPKGLSVTELRRLAPKLKDVAVRVHGFVVKQYSCPPCPPDAQCKPCMPDNIVLSDDPDLHDSYDLDDRDLIATTGRPKAYPLGEQVTVTLHAPNGWKVEPGSDDLQIIEP